MMSEQDFDRCVKEIEDRYHDRREGADAGRDQELALLFIEAKASGRDQKWIAQRMGQAESYVSDRLRFGRFVQFADREFSFSPPKPLTEWRFRSQWRASGKRPRESEDDRFARVLELLKADTSDTAGNYGNLVKKPGIKAAVADVLADGKRRTTPEVARIISERIPGIDATQVVSAIKQLRARPPAGMALDERHNGRSHRYRLVPRKNRAPAVSVDADAASGVAAESLPLIQECIEILKKPETRRATTLALDHLGRVERMLSRLLVLEEVV